MKKRFAWTSGHHKSSEGDAVGFSVGVRFRMLNKQGSRVRNQGCQLRMKPRVLEPRLPHSNPSVLICGRSQGNE